MPPATNTGMSLATLGRISCARTEVETGPIWPPASMPSITSASAPDRISFFASASAGAKQTSLAPLAAEVPIFVAGGIGHGGLIAGYLEMGAVGVQLGTRFVCSTECIAHPNFKKAFLRASARDAIPSVQIDPRLPVIPVRALKNREMENFAAKQREVAQKLDEGALAMAEAQLQIEHYWAGALKRAVIDGDVESGSVMAGQSVGMVNREEPVAAIIQELVDEAAAALESRG